MGSTALTLAAKAFQRANLDQALTSFSTSQSFPYNQALDIIQTVVMEMNRLGNFRSMLATQALTYTNGVYQYDLSSFSPYIEALRITRVYRTATNYQGNLAPYNWQKFWDTFRTSSIDTTTPKAFAWHTNTLEFDVIPDQDYSIVIEHYQAIPVPSVAGDTFGNWPTHDEDVIVNGCYAYLIQQMGRGDFNTVYQLYMNSSMALLADQKQVQSMPYQMPANW